MFNSALKLSLVTVLGGVTITSPFALSDKFSSKYPLNEQHLEKFKKSQTFDSCYSFLKEENKISFLFVCLKKLERANGDKTHLVNHYFYNGGSWEEAISLRKSPYSDNSLLVKTKAGWLWNKEREIKNSSEQKSNLDSFGLNKECQFQNVEVKGHQMNKRFFKCSVGGSDLKWNLEEFK